MAEISNNVLAVLVVTAFVVVLASAAINLIGADKFGLTGFATTDTGNVTLTINSTLAIQVNASQKTIAFGVCNPRAGSSYWCSSNDSLECDNTTLSLGNCSGDTTTPQYITVLNVGNIDANVSVGTSCVASQLIGGTSPAFQFVTTNCNGTGVSSWTTVPASASPALACTNLSFRGGAVRWYANVTIPYDAAPTCAGGTAILTFTAGIAP